MKVPLTAGIVLLASLTWSVAQECEPRVRPLREPFLLDHFGSEAIAFDRSDNTLWVTYATSRRVQHFDLDFDLLDEFQASFNDLPGQPSLTDHPTGITIHTGRDTLLLMRQMEQQIWEFTKDGKPVGKPIQLDLPRAPLDADPDPSPRGLEYDAATDSIWLVETIMTAIYEVDLFGGIRRSFCHPDDPDGCPGAGRAAGGSDLVLNHEGGELTSIDLVGVTPGSILRDALIGSNLEGQATGLRYSLKDLGGAVSGVERGLYPDPETGELVEAYFVVINSSAEIHVVQLVPPAILSIEDLSCQTVAGGDVELSWRNGEVYEQIAVRREGEEIASLPGTASSFTDPSPPDGVIEYEVVARSGGCEASRSCALLLGAGVVLNRVDLDGVRAIDLAEDADGQLWVTVAEPENRIQVFDKQLTLLADFASPFAANPDARTTGIAYNPSLGTLFVYDATTDKVAEIDSLGDPTGRATFSSGMPPGSLVTAMLFDPQADGGVGAFWYLDLNTGTLRQRRFSGQLIQNCVHPDQAASPPPPGADVRHFITGLTAVPGSGFDLVEMTGGSIREGEVRRILRLDTRTCKPTGDEIPVAGIKEHRTPFFLGLHRSVHRGRQVMYVLNSRSSSTQLLEVDAELSPVPVAARLSCRQPTPERRVELRFRTAPDVDEIRVFRDGEPLATLPAGTTSFEDLDVPAGFRSYALRAVKNGEVGDQRECGLQVGPGSIARREITNPVTFLQHLVYDPDDEVYLASSTGFTASENIHIYDRSLGKVGEFPSPFQRPREIAAMALRLLPTGNELYCLGWIPGAAGVVDASFPVRVVDMTGVLLRQLTMTVPRPRVAVIFPSGMTWDPATDTFWLLERNSRTVVNVSPDGETLGSFPHPASPHQDRVINYGLAIHPDTNTLYLSSNGSLDRVITKLVEVTRSGKLTGVEIPIGHRLYSRSLGFVVDADRQGFVVASRTGGVFDLVNYRAYDPLAPVESVLCAREGSTVGLSWTPGEAYDSVEVHREQQVAAVLDGAATSWSDPSPLDRETFYRVVGRRGEFRSAGVVCELPAKRPFIRGDVEENGDVNITDAIKILGYLFLGDDDPPCLDAADVDDDGEVIITDAVFLLNHLFGGGAQPRPPFPEPGHDPTEDDVTCG
ncbi:MAG: hypothetical protein O7J95_09775 [Planctomycetota bacterium]|nr:hypothetical protein [Planctomycetota bacterium]